MIERYTLPEMGRVWSDQHKYELWCKVETLVLEAHAAAGRVPADVVEPVRDAPPPTPERVAEIEETTQHDVIAFLTAWADNTTPRSAAAYVHHGMTSSDLLDTALAVQLTDATDVLLEKADRLVAALRDHGLKHRDTIKVGRTHGVHAEPDVWGHRVADLAFAAARIASGGFTLAGQSCISVQRVFVHEAVAAGFTGRLVDAVKGLKAGDPLDPATDVGPMIDQGETGHLPEGCPCFLQRDRSLKLDHRRHRVPDLDRYPHTGGGDGERGQTQDLAALASDLLLFLRPASEITRPDRRDHVPGDPAGERSRGSFAPGHLRGQGIEALLTGP